ncbi:MAG: alpha/beta hydrolase [Corynebacteriales bacterium]|nr:alpha/beta hydrolase [Mycobacteriales bacterium]
MSYLSNDANTDGRTVVTGSVFAPSGPAPQGGWPIVAVGHGSSGIDHGCGPSTGPDFGGELTTVSALVRAGYAVGLSDYQGLGTAGVHPYLDATTAGYNLIDSVRAVRATFSATSTRWAAVGGSQGGAAAWAANEEASAYAPELELIGSASLAPAADLTGLVGDADAGRLTTEQVPLYVWFVESMARTFTDVNRDAYRRGNAARDWKVLTSCALSAASTRVAAAERVGKFDLGAVDPAASRVLLDHLAHFTLPRVRATAPMIVIVGDLDRYVDPDSTRRAVARACALGDSLTFVQQSGRGHTNLDGAVGTDFLAKLFANSPPPMSCG